MVRQSITAWFLTNRIRRVELDRRKDSDALGTAK
jgi:hypothetical protein